MTPYEQARQLVLVMLKRIAAPTPDEIKETVKRVCDMLRGGGELDFSEEKLVIEIETLVDVWIGTVTTLDDTTDHEPLLGDKSPQIKWHFWKRYEQFLEQEEPAALDGPGNHTGNERFNRLLRRYRDVDLARPAVQTRHDLRLGQMGSALRNSQVRPGQPYRRLPGLQGRDLPSP